jgi:hypothetical protein
MPLKSDYQRIASRSLISSEATLASGIQEKAAFLSYHAFESTGCALSLSCGFQKVGVGVSHVKKINIFKTAARRCRNERAVASLAVVLSSLRNHLLYPIEDPATGAIQRPEDIITLTQARKVKQRVGGIVAWVDTQI